MIDVTQSMACIQCGACVSACLSMEVDPDFIGPAALAKAYRFVGDPRDSQRRERLYDLAQDPHGIYDCTHCFSLHRRLPEGRRADGPDHAPAPPRRRRRGHRRPQQRPPPRGGVHEDHREEGHARRVAAAPGVLRAGRQGQAEAARARSRAWSARSRPRCAASAPARCARSEADPRASTRSSPATRRTREAHLRARRGAPRGAQPLHHPARRPRRRSPSATSPAAATSPSTASEEQETG